LYLIAYYRIEHGPSKHSKDPSDFSNPTIF
jgi:hypothetical protein